MKICTFFLSYTTSIWNAFLKTTVRNSVSVLYFILHYLLHVSAPIGGHLQVKLLRMVVLRKALVDTRATECKTQQLSSIWNIFWCGQYLIKCKGKLFLILLRISCFEWLAEWQYIYVCNKWTSSKWYTLKYKHKHPSIAWNVVHFFQILKNE
jgi:hypothetical protein